MLVIRVALIEHKDVARHCADPELGCPHAPSDSRGALKAGYKYLTSSFSILFDCGPPNIFLRYIDVAWEKGDGWSGSA